MSLPFAYAAGRPFVEGWLPAPLLREGPLGLLWWQWLAIPVGIAVALLGGKVLGYLTRRILARVSRRTAVRWDDVLLERLAAPITALWSLATAYAVKLAIGLPEHVHQRLDRLLESITVAVLFWAALRSVETGFQAIAATPRFRSHALGQGLLPLLRKTTKIAVFSMGVVAVLTDLGYPVGGLLAGLGIGGLGLALAAQKTVENLFGSVSISVDQPFRVGDFVRLESGITGTVETIGLRSTRVRTLDRTIVTIPNGKLADQRVETFASRDRCKLFCTLSLARATRADQLRAVLDGVNAALRGQPRLWPEGVSVRFVAISASSLDVEVWAWFDTSSWDEFQVIREELLLEFLQVVERAGSALAYPTQTVEVVSPARGGGIPAQPAAHEE